MSVVVVSFDRSGPTAEVRGVGHRLPWRLPVPLATASRLVAQGVPLRVTHAAPAAGATTDEARAC